MKVGIDIRLLGWGNKAGICQYIYNLVSNILSLDSDNTYSLLAPLRGLDKVWNIADQFLYRFPYRLSTLFLEKLSVPVELIMGKTDIFHGPCFFIPNHIFCKSVVTIHDLMFLRHPEYLQPDSIAHFRKITHASVNRSDAIITVSNSSKNDVVEMLKVPEEKIRVIYNGVASRFRPVKEKAKIEEIKARYGIQGQQYILFTGNIEPKKNIETLIRAYMELRNTTIYKYPLLIVGNKEWHFEAVWKVVQQLRAEKDIVFTDFVDDEDLPHLYSNAELFVFPSLYEGFGLPVIEAMACGVPVVSSNTTSIPEIANGAAILVDPLNAGEIAGAMYSILSDSKLKSRLVTKGLERAREFSWEKAARETLKLYHEIR